MQHQMHVHGACEPLVVQSCSLCVVVCPRLARQLGKQSCTCLARYTLWCSHKRVEAGLEGDFLCEQCEAVPLVSAASLCAPAAQGCRICCDRFAHSCLRPALHRSSLVHRAPATIPIGVCRFSLALALLWQECGPPHMVATSTSKRLRTSLRWHLSGMMVDGFRVCGAVTVVKLVRSGVVQRCAAIDTVLADRRAGRPAWAGTGRVLAVVGHLVGARLAACTRRSCR